LFGRRRPRPSAPTVTPRSEAIEVARVELAELTPTPERYLGQTAYLTLVLFENLGRAVTAAPTTEAKSRLSRAAAEMLDAHEGLVKELSARHDDPVAEMDPFRIPLDDFQRRTQGADWYEILVTCYVTAGFLTDFFIGLSAGLRSGLDQRVTSLLTISDGEAVLVAELRAAIDTSPRLASRLAMWGRRLVGDTMLVARSALEQGGALPEERIEPVFTELVAAHTRRMDTLGLTA
jgi:hypothetical protein